MREREREGGDGEKGVKDVNSLITKGEVEKTITGRKEGWGKARKLRVLSG